MGSPPIASGGWDVDPCMIGRGVMGWSRGVLDLHNATAEILMLCGSGRLRRLWRYSGPLSGCNIVGRRM